MNRPNSHSAPTGPKSSTNLPPLHHTALLQGKNLQNVDQLPQLQRHYLVRANMDDEIHLHLQCISTSLVNWEKGCLMIKILNLALHMVLPSSSNSCPPIWFWIWQQASQDNGKNITNVNSTKSSEFTGRIAKLMFKSSPRPTFPANWRRSIWDDWEPEGHESGHRRSACMVEGVYLLRLPN